MYVKLLCILCKQAALVPCEWQYDCTGEQTWDKEDLLSAFICLAWVHLGKKKTGHFFSLSIMSMNMIYQQHKMTTLATHNDH